jgi:hypothetical protein
MSHDEAVKSDRDDRDDDRDDDRPEDAEEERVLEERIAGYLRLGIPSATLACAVVGGVLQGAAAAVIVLAAGALVAVIAIFWASVRTLVGETALSGADAYALGAPRAEEEQKRAVLRALKDLEFERSMGKISEADYEALVAKYRAEGKRLIRILDEESGPRRKKVEAIVNDRLVRAGLAEPREPEPRELPPDEAKPGDSADKPRGKKKKKAKAANAAPAAAKATPAAADARSACAECGTQNDADAVFCKKCGARQHAEVDEAKQETPKAEPPREADEDAEESS